MPYIELKQPKNFIRIKKQGTVVSRDVYREFFENKKLEKVQVFLDSPHGVIGLKPSDEGYKLVKHGGGISFFCVQLSRTVNGEFHPVWSRKHKMLLFKFP